MSRHVQRQHWYWWALMGVAVLVILVTQSGTTPTTGDSDERLFSIAGRIKCVQCVGESVASSQSASAVQFREEIASQMKAGRTNDEILNFFADRYEGVLLTPPASGVGALVWVIPVIVIAGAALLFAGTFRRWRSERSDDEATSEDEALVAQALAERRSDPSP